MSGCTVVMKLLVTSSCGSQPSESSELFPQEKCSNVAQNLMQIRRSTRSVILNVMTTQSTRPLNGVSRPH